MPRGGWKLHVKPSAAADSDADRIRRLERYNEFRRELRAAGFDPDFIGAHEVESVCCRKCGSPIPWKTLRGWQD
jgi:hypothetical protein